MSFSFERDNLLRLQGFSWVFCADERSERSFAYYSYLRLDFFIFLTTAKLRPSFSLIHDFVAANKEARSKIKKRTFQGGTL